MGIVLFTIWLICVLSMLARANYIKTHKPLNQENIADYLAYIFGAVGMVMIFPLLLIGFLKSC